MAKHTAKRKRGKDARYWKGRLTRGTFTRNGERKETRNWCVRIQHIGKRKLFNLGTANKDSAAELARKIHQFVTVNGWEKAEAKFLHGDEKKRIKAEKDAPTVGQYIEMAKGIASGVNARTIQDYGACVRRVVWEILADGDKKPAREKIDATSLDFITGVRLEKWKAGRLRRCEGNPIEEERAKTTANTILRQSRALFGRKIAPKLAEDGNRLPNPLPFSNVDLFPEDTSAKFRHDVEPGELIAAAAELDAPQADKESEEDFEARRQRFLGFVLLFAVGLRRKEADFLEWGSVDLDGGKIRVERTEYFEPKTKASARPVSLDPETVKILRGFRAQFPEGRFVMRSKRKPRRGVKYAYYRAEKTWKGLAQWLTAHGVKDRKPLHYCRKAITAHVAKEFGIFAAQRHARHTTPQITARYYSDSEESIAPGIGGLFETPQKSDSERIEEGKFKQVESAKKTDLRRAK